MHYAAIAGSYGVRLDMAWFREGATNNGTWLNPSKMREVLGHLRDSGMLAWAKDSALEAAAAAIGVESASETETTIYLGAAVFGFVGLPPNAPAMVSSGADGLRVAIAFDTRGIPPGYVDVAGEGMREVLQALEGYTGLTARPGADKIVLEMEVGDGAAHRTILHKSLAGIVFEPAAYDAWRVDHQGRKADGEAKYGAQVVGNHLTADEQAFVQNWTRQHVGTSTESATPPTRELLALINEIEANPYRELILAAVRSSVGPERMLDGETLRQVVHHATFQAERAALGAAPDRVGNAEDHDAIFQAPLPAHVAARAGLVSAGEEVEFEVVVDWARVPMDRATQELFNTRMWRVAVDWVFERGDKRVVAHTKSASVKQRLFLSDDEEGGVWTAHAFVRTSHYWPTRMEPVLVEVKPWKRHMEQLEQEVLGADAASLPVRSSDHEFEPDGTWDALNGGTLEDMVGRINPTVGNRGKIFTGRLPFASRTNEARHQEREAEIQNLEATIAYLRSRPGKFNDAIAAAEATLKKRRDEQTLLDGAEATETAFEVRATFFSRTPGVASGPLRVYGTSKPVSSNGSASTGEEPAMWRVTLYDTSKAFGSEHLTIKELGVTFDEALETAFVKLCKAYPDGRMALFAQRATVEGTTNEMIGFELGTTSVGENVADMLKHSAVGLAIGLGTIFAMMFPPAVAGIAIMIGAVYGAVSTAAELKARADTGTLTNRRLGIGLANLVMSILPGIRSMKAISSSRGALFALDAAELTGNVLLFVEDVKQRLEEIEAEQVGALAELYAELVRATQATHASDPNLAKKRAEIEARALEVSKNLHKALADAAADNFMVLADVAQAAGSITRSSSNADVDAGSSSRVARTPDVHDDTTVPRQDDEPPAQQHDATERPHPRTRDEEGAPRREQPEPTGASEADRILQLPGPAPDSPLRKPGVVDTSSTLEHLGLQIALNVGGGSYAGNGVFVLDVGADQLAVRIVRTRGATADVRHDGGEYVIQVPRKFAGFELERAVVSRLTEVREQAVRRNRGEKTTATSALGSKGDGGRLSPADMADIADLRVVKRHHEAALAKGPDHNESAAALQHEIDAIESRLALNDTSPEGQARRNAVDAQLVVQNDQARRSRVADELEGDVGHPGVELHTHFMGIVQAEVFRDRAAKAVGAASSSWIPLLDRIAAFSGDSFVHDRNKKGKITKRAPAGDAVDIAQLAQNEVEPLLLAAKSNDANAPALLHEAETLAEEACRSALSATPHTEFDSAYEVRDQLVKETFGTAQPGKTVEKQDRYDDLIRETVLELVREGVGYVEPSASVNKLAGVLDPDRIEAIITKMVADGVILPGQVDPRMLAMTLTGQLGARAKNLPPVREPTTTLDDDVEKAQNQVREKPRAIGHDVGGPEHFDWGTATPQTIAELCRTYSIAATASGHAFVLRPHVGEGAVDTVAGEAYSRDTNRHTTQDNEASHYARARNNIERFLDGLELANKNGDLDPSKVIVRMGHVTHATPAQAARMADLGVIAEVNLGSNIVTGSVIQTDGATGEPFNHESLKGHSFPSLLYYGVPIAISTDAGAVMNTTLRQEYARARRFIEDVLAGTAPIRIAAADAKIGQTDQYRGTPVAGRPGEYDLVFADLTPNERGRFLNGYEKLYADAKEYYQRRPKSDGATEHSPYEGEHHTDIATHNGLVRSRGNVLFEGVGADVTNAANEYREAGYQVVQDELAGKVLLVTVTSPDGHFTTTLRSWPGDGPEYIPVDRRGHDAPPLSNDEVRAWYHAQIARIGELDKAWHSDGVALEERARRAFEIRKHARLAAREQMASGDVVSIQVRDLHVHGYADGAMFDELVEKQLGKGKTLEQAYAAIIKSAQRTDEGYNERHARRREKQ